MMKMILPGLSGIIPLIALEAITLTASKKGIATNHNAVTGAKLEFSTELK